MPQVINTNVASLNAQRNLNTSQTALSVSLQRLSSGLRINSAKDDAAGLAISERFTTQIRGLNQATRNANDGISLAQTGEGALAEIGNNLQRIRELAVQSVNATNSNSDRVALDAEVQQRLAEINRISAQTSFNGQKILDGSFGNALFQVGANVGETISLSLATSTRTDAIGSVATATSTVDVNALLGTTGGIQLAAGDLTINGVSVTQGTYSTAASLATAINAAAGRSVAAATGNVITFTNTTATAINIGGADNRLGITTVAAAVTTPTVNSTSITSVDFNQFAVGASGGFTIQVGAGTTVNVAQGSYTAATLATAINAAYTTAGGAGTLATASGGAITLDNTDPAGDGSKQVTLGGTQLTALGIINPVLADDGPGVDTATIASTVFNQYAVTALTVNGNGITNGSYTAATLATAINGAVGQNVAAAASGDVTITNTTTSAVTFAGADAGALGIGTVAAATITNGTSSSTDLTTALATTNASNPLIVNNDFSVQIGNTGGPVAVANGTYETGLSIVDAINTALGSNGRASLDTTTGFISITASDTVNVLGTAGTTLGLPASTLVSGNLATSNVLTVAASNTTLQRIDSALTAVNGLRSNFGAVQNRFDSVIANLQTTTENLTASRSRILDADFAQETAALTRAQILQQAGVAMLAQANALPQNVLSLLRG